MVVNMLSQTSKMPSKSISISAFRCITGSKLAMKKGTVCFKCYARRGFYRMPNNKKAMADRLIFMKSPDFIPKMVKLLQDELRFRWFDSGDTQSHKMCEDILTIARLHLGVLIGYPLKNIQCGEKSLWVKVYQFLRM
jgi:hypothetical protein